MNRSAIAMAVLVVAGTLAAFPVAGMALTADEQDSAANNSSVAPGERLAGVVGVQEAEFEGEIRVRAFDIAFDRADNNTSKAEVIAREAGNASQRLAELAERKAALEEARENGSLSEGEYRARMAKVSAEMETVERIANESEERAGGLPAETLEANGVNVTAIQTLRAQASALNGPEVAAIARSIAGNERGESPEQVRDRRGGDGEAGNASEAVDRAERQVESARERVERAEERVNESNASDNATEALERAREQLAAAEEALADARNASEAGDDDRARERAQAAIEHADQAQQHANDAVEAARQQGSRDGGSEQTATRDGSDDGGEQTDTSDSGGSDY